MKGRNSRAFDRALRIELLRARSTLEREAIARHACGLCDALDPRKQLAGLMPTSVSGLLTQLSRVVFRYPYLFSGGASLFASQVLRPRRLLAIAAIAFVTWRVRRQLDA